jgi:hypothetical protein
MSETQGTVRAKPDVWRDLGEIATAHVIMLRDVGIIDDPEASDGQPRPGGTRRGHLRVLTSE